MSSPPVRRVDKLMPRARIEQLLATGYCGHLAAISPDGSPYVCPLLYVWLDGQAWLHNTSAHGHLQCNVRHDQRVCFEVCAPGEVFAYGRYECDTSIAYQSIVLFGRAAIIDDRPRKTLFFDALMAKYHGDDSTRPKSFYPRLDAVTVYAVTTEHITGRSKSFPQRIGNGRRLTIRCLPRHCRRHSALPLSAPGPTRGPATPVAGPRYRATREAAIQATQDERQPLRPE